MHQLNLFRRGGARRGAGRKPKGAKALASHARRDALAARHPVLVTTRLRACLPDLRRKREFEVVLEAFAGSIADEPQHGFRLVHFSVQTNHLHILVEARDTRSLTRGMRGLLVRMARGLNRLWRRKGQVIADRYDARALRSPREVRNALSYLLNNARKHGCLFASIDPFTSGRVFDGWTWSSGSTTPNALEAVAAHGLPVLAPRTWLLACGWRRHGLIDPAEIPGSVVRVRRTSVARLGTLDMTALRRAARSAP